MVSKRYAIGLWCLLGLFFFRVVAQLIQAVAPVSFLPPFERWHSAVFSYPILFLIQSAILIFLFKVALTFSRGKVIPSRTSGRIWLVLGGVYLIIMAARFTLGLTIYSDHFWFSNHVPTLFHIVLASFLLIVAKYHLRFSSSK
jgi:hypothetical protein